MSNQEKCKAYQQSDTMVCDHCGLTWDMNDADPPNCEKVELVPTMKLRYKKTNMNSVLQQLHLDNNPSSPVSEVWIDIPVEDVSVG